MDSNYEIKNEGFRRRLEELIGEEKPFPWAQRIGITPGVFNRMWNEGVAPKADTLEKIAETTGVSIDWLLMGRGPKRLEEGAVAVSEAAGLDKEYVIPRYDVQASAGGGALVHSEQIVDYLAFKTEWLREHVGISPSHALVISVAGDSMEPALGDGDLILVDTAVTRFEQDAIYVLQVRGALMVKRVQVKLDGTVIVKSDNERYESEVFRGEDVESLRVIGRMVRRVVR
ncbi:S24 family peptidase [Pseudomonas sp.]|uniref:S24 family peptidase n=1 Tax=Pseudomonas sp. TaxID=306 RepID=UPI003D0B10A6